MNEETPIGPSVFSKLLAIWVVILVIIIATAIVAGGQVYWWQKAVAQKEQQKLGQQIVDLQNEIKVLKTNGVIDPKPVSKAQPPAKLVKSGKNQVKFKEELAGRESKVITLLENSNMEDLAKYVHPEFGLRFSPSSYVDLKKDLVFSRAEIIKFFHHHLQYTWGYNEENGLPIRFTPSDYYQNYVYDRAYADTHEINYNQTTRPEFTTSNCFEVYPHAIIVEYWVHESGSKEEKSSINWRSLRLVFEIDGKTWYLVGIIHDQWML
jgi:hypothetical protein